MCSDFLAFPTLLLHPFPQPFEHFFFILSARSGSNTVMKYRLSTTYNKRQCTELVNKLDER
jgi:hypothetical protein